MLLLIRVCLKNHKKDKRKDEVAGRFISRKQRQIKSAARSGCLILPIHLRTGSRRSADWADFFCTFICVITKICGRLSFHKVITRFIRSACWSSFASFLYAYRDIKLCVKKIAMPSSHKNSFESYKKVNAKMKWPDALFQGSKGR